MTIAGAESKKMVITISTEDGTVKVEDENGNTANQLPLQELEKISQSQGKLNYVGTILYSHSSPGCVYYTYLGSVFVICS